MDDGLLVFVVAPVLLVWVVAVAIGVKRGLWRGVAAFAIGLFVLLACWVGLLVFYYANGGH